MVTQANDAEIAHGCNEVRLRGRLGADAVERQLPSGARIVTFRVVIGREQTVMTRGSQQKSDWVECTAWASPLRRKMARWRSGDVVEIEGALRRRHYRAGAVGSSRVDVEVLEGTRVRKAVRPARVAAGPAP